MKQILLSLILGTLFAASVFADEVNPIDTDEYKSLVVTVKILDDRLLPNVFEKTGILVQFGSSSVNIPTNKAKKGIDVVEKLTIPLANSGNYSIRYYMNYEYSYSGEIALEKGKVVDGIKYVEIRLKRIDVHNMVVTRPDGSTYVVIDGNTTLKTEAISSIRFYTGKGIDVPVSRVYNVDVNASTEDGPAFYSAKLDFTLL